MHNYELKAIAEQPNSEIVLCPILEQRNGFIRFEVDSGLCKPSKHLAMSTANDVIDSILETEQIDSSLKNIIASSLDEQQLCILGSDVLWKTFVTCFAEHRPLVLSPDIIWLLISQNIANHVRQNAEELRSVFVDFGGEMDLCIQTAEELDSKTLDWASLFEQFYHQINQQANAEITSNFINDFSTTGPTEKLASVATLMGVVESYFRYHVFDCICGIPYITLKGTSADWNKVLARTSILSKLGLSSWQNWLEPILKEFIRTAEGFPNARFWKSIVMDSRPDNFSTERSCIPVDTIINGWCVALFPFVEGEEQPLNEQDVNITMDSEMLRVGFQYHKLKPNIGYDTTHMELWAGFVGVEEDRDSYTLTPKIGWFARKSDQEKESLARLKRQDDICGIDLRIKEVPLLLAELTQIHCLTLDFIGKIDIPDWMEEIEIERFTVSGIITPEEMKDLQKRFKNITIYPEQSENAQHGIH